MPTYVVYYRPTGKPVPKFEWPARLFITTTDAKRAAQEFADMLNTATMNEDFYVGELIA